MNSVYESGGLMKSYTRLSTYKQDILFALNNELATVSELANKYGIDKGALAVSIRGWKQSGELSRNVKIVHNGSMTKHKPDPEKKLWWQEALGEAVHNQADFKYNNPEAAKAVETSRYIIYTDGSCFVPENQSEGKGGWAVIVQDRQTNETQEFYGSDQPVTANRMELTAVLEAVKYIADDTPAIIYTDSQYAAQSVKLIPKWKRNGWRTDMGQTVSHNDIVLNIFELMSKKKFEVQWVKAHNGDSLNERCDLLARTAAKEQICCPPPKPKRWTSTVHPTNVPSGYIAISEAAHIVGSSGATMHVLISSAKITVAEVDGRRFPLKDEIEIVHKLHDRGRTFSSIKREDIDRELGNKGGIAIKRNPWVSATEAKQLLELNDEQLAKLVGRGGIETDVQKGHCVYNSDTVNLSEVQSIIDEDRMIAAQLNGMLTEEQILAKYNIDTITLRMLVDDGALDRFGLNGTMYYKTLSDITSKLAELKDKEARRFASNIIQTEPIIAIPIQKSENEEDEEMRCDCTPEEKKFAEMYVRYGCAIAAKKFQISEEEANMRWLEFLIDYDVELSITKK